MFYRVNDKCIGCGMCEGICPEVFKIMPDGFAIAKKDVPDGAHNSAEEENVAPTEREIMGSLSLRKHSWNMIVYQY